MMFRFRTEMRIYRPGDRVQDATGKFFLIELEGDFVSIEVAQKDGFEIVDRAAYGAFDRAALGLARLHRALPAEAYAAVFELVLHIIGCEPMALARAVVRERKNR